MRTVIYFLFFSLLSISGKAQPGFLKITSTPSNAQILLDGKYIGLTPLFQRDVSVGNHKVECFYKNYETQTKNIILGENENLNVTFNLKETSGFKVKPVETSEMNQAKGSLTIITDPDNSEITIDGIPVEQKTPVTITEIGAGNKLVGVSNFVNIHGQYKKFTIDTSFHIRPNKTELLEVNFKDYFGSAEINSIPGGAEVFIDNINEGVAPYRIDFLPIGTHNIRVEANLNYKPFFGRYQIIDDINISPKRTIRLNYDFYKQIKTGGIQIKSNKENTLLTFNNLTYDLKFQLNPGYSDKLVAARYKIEWLNGGSYNGSSFTDKYEFDLEANRNYLLYIPVKENLHKLYMVNEIPGYISIESYYSQNYNPLPETKTKKVLRFSSVWYMGPLLALGSVGLLSLAAHPENVEGGGTGSTILYGGLGIAVGVVAVLVPFKRDHKTVTLKQNVNINTTNHSRLENEYQSKSNLWNQKLDELNKPIIEKNNEIKKSNEALPPPNVTVIK
jgi:hypothetical protein